MHWSVDFHDPVADPTREPTLFEWAGGYPALLDMTRIFYSRHVPSDPLIGPLFATMSPDHPERVAAWLSEVFGGPKFYSERYGGYARMISQHVGKGIRPEQRARWAALMAQSADEAGLPQDAEFRAAFIAYIEWGSRIAVENSQGDAHPPPNMPVPRWWWVCEATPGARVSALAPVEETAPEAAAELAPGEAPDFARHIRPLFRPMDRNSMRFAFDLWSETDLRAHGQAILARLRAGTMPCDGAWPGERIDIFERWLATD
jgi:truncated hemoglobin YjbI